MISWFVSWRPASGFALSAWSLPGILCLLLSAPPPLMLAHALSLKINKYTLKKHHTLLGKKRQTCPRASFVIIEHASRGRADNIEGPAGWGSGTRKCWGRQQTEDACSLALDQVPLLRNVNLMLPDLQIYREAEKSRFFFNVKTFDSEHLAIS